MGTTCINFFGTTFHEKPSSFRERSSCTAYIVPKYNTLPFYIGPFTFFYQKIRRDLIYSDSYSQSNPFDFVNGSSGAAVLSMAIHQSDIVELLVYRQPTATAGDLVGLNFSVTFTAIPEPADGTAILAAFALAVAGSRLIPRKSRKTARHRSTS